LLGGPGKGDVGDAATHEATEFAKTHFFVRSERGIVVGPHESNRGSAWQACAEIIKQAPGEASAALRCRNANRAMSTGTEVSPNVGFQNSLIRRV
jgi:hypothetical protein